MTAAAYQGDLLQVVGDFFLSLSGRIFNVKIKKKKKKRHVLIVVKWKLLKLGKLVMFASDLRGLSRYLLAMFPVSACFMGILGIF